MPTFLSHPAVPLAIGLDLGSKVIPSRLLMVGIALSVLPDLDVLAFRFGVSYASDIGHRGFSHSLIFAALAALLGTSCFRQALLWLFGFCSLRQPPMDYWMPSPTVVWESLFSGRFRQRASLPRSRS